MHVSHIPWRKKLLYFLPLVLFFVIACPGANAQRIALKTNSLEYFILSPNLTFEARLSRVLSLQVGLAANPINKPIGGFKMTNFRVEPELRYWFNRPMARHFMAVSVTAGAYSLQIKDRYLLGDAVAAGISYGYALVLSDHWNMEAEIGIGLGSFRGYNFKGKDNKPEDFNFRHTMPVPIRFGLSFGYVFK